MAPRICGPSYSENVPRRLQPYCKLISISTVQSEISTAGRILLIENEILDENEEQAQILVREKQRQRQISDKF